MRSRLLGSNTPAIASSSAASVADEMRRITPRDLTLLTLLDSHRVLTTHQITAALFTSDDRAWHRCKTLYRRGVLDRFRRWTPKGTAPYHWTLGHLGARILAASNESSAPRPAELRERRDRLAASPHLGHLVGVNTFFTDLHAVARQHEHLDLITWESERQASNLCAGAIRPDGGALWRDQDRTVAFWFEYDTGTEDLARLVAKLDGYTHLLGSRAQRSIAFWFQSSAREQHFVARATRARLSALHVATASADYACTLGGASGRVWSRAGAPERVRLGELPPTPGEGTTWGA